MYDHMGNSINVVKSITEEKQMKKTIILYSVYNATL